MQPWHGYHGWSQGPGHIKVLGLHKRPKFCKRHNRKMALSECRLEGQIPFPAIADWINVDFVDQKAFVQVLATNRRISANAKFSKLKDQRLLHLRTRACLKASRAMALNVLGQFRLIKESTEERCRSITRSHTSINQP